MSFLDDMQIFDNMQIAQPKYNWMNTGGQMPGQAQMPMFDFSKMAQNSPLPSTLMQSAIPAVPPAIDPPVSGGWGDLFSADKMKGYGSIASGIGSAFGAWNGYNQLGLQEDMFDFNKGITETNLANQARALNNQMRTVARNNYAFQGGAANPDNPHKTADNYVRDHGMSETVKDNKNRQTTA